MKITLFLPTLAGGGAEKVALDLGNAFVSAGHEVDLVVATAVGELVGQVPVSMTLVDLEARRTVAALPRLVRHLRRRRPDVILSFLSNANAVAAAAVMLVRSRPRLVVSERSNRSKAIREMGPLMRVSMRVAMRWTFHRADAVIGISAGVTGDLVTSFGLSRAKAHTIYNPVDRAGLVARARPTSGHPWVDCDGPPVVLAIGRLRPEKDFRSLIDAFRLIRARRDARLIILGEGECRDALLRSVEDYGLQDDVDLPGFVHNSASYLARADVFVLSSIREGFGNVIAEAVALGTPVVSTDCPHGPSEILEQGRWGRLVPVGDRQALAAAIDDALVGRVPPASPEACHRFSLPSITEQYLAVMAARPADRPA